VQILNGNVRREVLRQVAIHAIKRQLVPSVVKRCHHVEIGTSEWKAAGRACSTLYLPTARRLHWAPGRLRLVHSKCQYEGPRNRGRVLPNTAKLNDPVISETGTYSPRAEWMLEIPAVHIPPLMCRNVGALPWRAQNSHSVKAISLYRARGNPD